MTTNSFLNVHVAGKAACSETEFFRIAALDIQDPRFILCRMQHNPIYVGGPCRHCGLSYAIKTAYTPCLEDGETLESWRARQSEAVLALTFDNQRAKKDE